jgi:hypothetical protein
MICENLPKIVFRFLDFWDLYPFVLSPATLAGRLLLHKPEWILAFVSAM